MAHIAPLAGREYQLYEKVDDKHDAHPQLEGHVAVVGEEVVIGECVVRYIYDEDYRKDEHDRVHRPFDDLGRATVTQWGA